jgi:hypothetical protein
MIAIEPVRFSWLKNFARSPAHAKAALDDPRKPTAAMDLGAIAHRLVLGPRHGDGELAVWNGGRRYGKTWDAFREEHAADVIVTSGDFYRAKKIAEAVRADETASAILGDGAVFELPHSWIESGFKCETRGVDIFRAARGEPGFSIWEFKTTTNVEPEKLKRHAMQMLYPQQLELYRGGLESTGAGPCREAGIIAVEVERPHVVTCLTLSPALLAWARRSLTLWLERLKVCVADSHWPGFAQRAVDFDLPPWLVEESSEEEEATDAA